jgi:GTPase
VLFGSQLKELPESYLRYLVHAMRTAFKMPGTPVRVNLRSTTNPYTE